MRVQNITIMMIFLAVLGCNSSSHDAPSDTSQSPQSEEKLARAPFRHVVEIDLGADGTLDDVYYRYYYENANPMEEEKDFGRDGTIDEVCTFYYGKTGLLERYEVDEKNNGTINLISYYYFNGEEQIEKIESDFYADGFIDFVEYYIYDDSKVLQRIEGDYLRLGSRTDIIQYMYYAADGDLASSEIDFTPAGAPDNKVTYFYDADGVLEKEERYEGDLQGEMVLEEYRYHSWEELSVEGSAFTASFVSQADSLSRLRSFHSSEPMATIMPYLPL